MATARLKSEGKERWLAVRSVAVLTAVFFAILWPSFSEVLYTVFSDRDLSRASELLSGRLIFSGPELSGGGAAPGGFFYYLISPAYWIGGWKAVGLFSRLLTALAAAVLWTTLRSYGTAIAAPLATILFFYSPAVFKALRLLWNPSFAVLFILFAVWGLVCFFSQASVKSQRALAAAAISVGLAIQIHVSSSCLLVAFIILATFSKPLRLRRPSLRHVTLFFILSLGPLALSWLANHYFGTQPWVQSVPMYAGDLAGAIATVGNVTSLADNFLVTIGKVSVRLGGIGVLLPCAIVFFCAVRSKQCLVKSEIIVSGILAIVSMLLILPSQIWPYGDRYLLPFAIPLCFLIGYLIIWLESLIDARWLVLSKPGVQKSLFLVMTLICFRVTQLKLDSMCNVPVNKRYLYLTVSQTQSLTEHLTVRTDWDLEEAKSRLYFLSHHSELGFDEIFNEQRRRRPLPVERDQFDGYFVTESDPKEVVLTQYLDPIIVRAIQVGALRLSEPQFLERLALVPYTVIDENLIPKKLHNRGAGYSNFGLDALSKNWVNGQLQALGENKWRWHGNDCPDQAQNCYYYIDVSLSNEAGRRQYLADVSFHGRSLSQGSLWITPTWTQGLSDVSFVVRCRDAQPLQFPIARRIGEESRTALVTRSFLTPLHRKFRFSCTEGLNELEVSWPRSYVFRNYPVDPNEYVILGRKISIAVPNNRPMAKPWSKAGAGGTSPVRQ